jgi:hypothetical protein
MPVHHFADPIIIQGFDTDEEHCYDKGHPPQPMNKCYAYKKDDGTIFGKPQSPGIQFL